MAVSQGQTRVVILATLAVAMTLIAFPLVSCGDDDDGADPAPEGPTIVSVEELKEIAEDAEHPIYWAGERPGTRLEYERTEDDLIYVRYLTGESEAGDPSPSSLTIGTYKVDDPVRALEEIAERPNNVRHDLPDGGLVVINTEQPNSAYVAYPDAGEQVEVYDPDPSTAIRVATSGEVVPID